MPKSIMTKISDEQFAELVKNSYSAKEVGVKCGYSNLGGSISKLVKARIERQGLDISHFKRKECHIWEDKDIFVEDSQAEHSTMRKHYKEGHYSEYKCAICGMEPFWNGKELTLTLDHINGHNRDNRLENLRWICPNCDRQLDTYAGRNIVTNREETKNYCIDCGIEIIKSSTRCPACSAIEKGKRARKVERPSRKELKSKIRTQSFVQIGRDYGVTDNAIRKWCDEYSLPRTKKAIQKIKDIDWELL